MIYSHRKKDKRKTHVLDADKKEEYVCPDCGDQVRPSQGQIVPWHFFHVTNSQCIVGNKKGKGCIFAIKENNKRICKSAGKCDRDCLLRHMSLQEKKK